MKSESYNGGYKWRDPEDRQVDLQDSLEIREKMLDKTIADSFPASDPPSTDPAPAADSFVQATVQSSSNGFPGVPPVSAAV